MIEGLRYLPPVHYDDHSMINSGITARQKIKKKTVLMIIKRKNTTNKEQLASQLSISLLFCPVK